MKLYPLPSQGDHAQAKQLLCLTSEKLEETGYAVFTVPEAATICINGGINPSTMNSRIVQTAIMKTVYDLEQNFFEAALKIAKEKPVVILCDRGIPDVQAYADKSLYEEILRSSLKLNPVVARDKRYKAVIHLRTVADGKPEYYTQLNNTARYEDTIEKALAQDKKSEFVWYGHPHLRVIDNSTDLEGKKRRVHKEICAILGIPIPIERESKFLVRYNQDNIPSNAQHVTINQAYMRLTENEEIRVRKRGQDGYFAYYQTIKRPGLKSDERLETEKNIEESEYLFGLSLMQHGTGLVEKTRTCFVYENQYLELDRYKDSRILEGEADGLLELESTEKNPDIQIPEWMTVVREVTNDPRYKNSYFAQKVV